MSEPVVRIRNTELTIDEESTSISQRKFFEGKRAGEDEMCDGVESPAVPSELEVQFRVA
jgi:hypothetical protein